MSESDIRADTLSFLQGAAQVTIDSQNSTEGDDISDQHVALLSNSINPTSPTTSCAGLPTQSQDNAFTDDGYVSDARKITIATRVKKALHLAPSEGPDPRIEQIVKSLDDYDPGYGKVAAIEDLDGDFLVLRKFGWLHNYALLYLQDELVQQQAEIESFEKWESQNGDSTKLVSRRKDHAFRDSRRKDLLGKLQVKLAQYDELLLRMQKIQGIKRPTKRSQSNLSTLIGNTQSLVSEESDWIRCGPDLAALGRGSEHGWLNTFLEDMLNKISPRLTMGIFRSQEQKLKTGGNEDLQLLSAERLDIFLQIVLTITATVLLLAPVFTLFRLQPTTHAEFHSKSNYQILTVLIFTLLFSASCSIFTKAKRQEVFTATAAYCAVLVVFLGNTSSVLIAQGSSSLTL